jgi:hypothetical protein
MPDFYKYRVFYRAGTGMQRREHCIEFRVTQDIQNPAILTMVAYGAMWLEGVEYEEDMHYLLEKKDGRRWVEVTLDDAPGDDDDDDEEYEDTDE